MDKKVRKQLFFEDEKVLRILDLAGRKQSELITAALDELCEKYGLSDNITDKEMKKFIAAYPYLKNISKAQGTPLLIQNAVHTGNTTQSTQSSANKKDSSVDALDKIFGKKNKPDDLDILDDNSSAVSASAAASMNHILAGFMSQNK